MSARPSRGAASSRALEAAGVRRALIPIPVPVPPTNAWVLGRGEVAMVDCGALYGDAHARLSEVLDPGERIGALLITHGHPDHHGAARWVQWRHGCRVLCHPFDAPAVRDFAGTIGRRFEAWSKAGAEHGVPESLIARMGDRYRMIAAMGAGAEPVEPLADGDKLDMGGRTLEVLHLPGHTAGSVALLDRKAKVLFSGDTVLPGITPNPFFEGISDHPSGPGPFLASLARLRKLEVKLVLPGHGDPLTDLRAVLSEYEAHHAERRAAIAAFLKKEGKGSAFATVEALFPGATPLDQWLAFAEILGHLQFMEARGEVAREGAVGATRWRPAK